MTRIILLLFVCAAWLEAGMLVGARYGVMMHNAKYADESPKDKNIWGPGALIGYDADSFRIIGTHDVFDADAKGEAAISTVGLHLIEQRDEEIRGFLGIDVGNLSYRHTSQQHTEKENIGVYGLAIGIVLLDERFPSAQMEITYRYLRTYGSMPDELSLDYMSHIYLGLTFDLF